MAQVAIIMSVRNGAATLPRALGSVSEQTLADWEAVIVDDASSDDTGVLLRRWGRAQIIRHEESWGLTRSLNQAIEHGRAPIIARLDADDWWAADKLAKQMKFLQQHPNVGLLGCWYINHRGAQASVIHTPVGDQAIRRRIWWRNPFGHSCVVMRRELFEQVGCYNEQLAVGQDLDLWFRLLGQTQVANFPEVLCHRRVAANPAKQRQQMQQTIKTVRTYRRLYNKPWWYELALTEAFFFAYLR